jgi:glutathione synthase
MAHILLIDKLEQLDIKKDSSLFFAIGLQDKFETYICFREDLSFVNSSAYKLKVYKFDGEISENYYVSEFNLKESIDIKLSELDTIHMRLDPPVNLSYIRTLWLLKSFEDFFGVSCVNSSEGILSIHEKLYAYSHKSSIESFVGKNKDQLHSFISSLGEENSKLVVKPLDMFQGIGVKLFNRTDIENIEKYILESSEEMIVQPFYKKISEGEVRSIYFKGHEIGSILKTPKEGEFISNIAFGAKYTKYDLNEYQRNLCDEVSNDLLSKGIDWIAFDIMGEHLSEVNLTCPGLLVEVSSAYQENLAQKIINLF